MADNLNVLRIVGENLRTYERMVAEAPDFSWRWAYSVVMFPDTKCPWCLTIVRNKAIWFFTEDGERLKGQAIPVDGQPFKLRPPQHPHAARNTGEICHGDGRPEDFAIHMFLGLNPRSPINPDTYDWLRTFCDHVCPDGPNNGNQYECRNCGAIRGCRMGTCEECWPGGRCENCSDHDICSCGCGCRPSAGDCGCGCEECHCDDEPDDEG